MELVLRPTTKIVQLVVEGGAVVPARIWQGKTSTGIPVHCYITRVAVDHNRPEHELAEFERALQEQEAPRADVQSIPLRLIL